MGKEPQAPSAGAIAVGLSNLTLRDSFGPRMISTEMESAARCEGSTQIPIGAEAIRKRRQDALAGFCVNPLDSVVRYRIIQLPVRDALRNNTLRVESHKCVKM